MQSGRRRTALTRRSQDVLMSRRSRVSCTAAERLGGGRTTIIYVRVASAICQSRTTANLTESRRLLSSLLLLSSHCSHSSRTHTHTRTRERARPFISLRSSLLYIIIYVITTAIIIVVVIIYCPYYISYTYYIYIYIMRPWRRYYIYIIV